MKHHASGLWMKAEQKPRRTRWLAICAAMLLLFTLCSCGADTEETLPETSAPSVSTQAEEPQETEIETEAEEPEETQESAFALSDIPDYAGRPYVAVNGNVPYFSDDDLTTSSFESYSSLDSLGRCGAAYACIGTDLMPTEERGSIGQAKPSGWHTVRYDGLVDGNYLYNRCHLIGYQLTGENANTRNLITGTRYLNMDGMLPFENMVADYIKETGNHVLYRVTPVFDGNSLVANGVLMEAESVEDEGEGILFNVYCYNVQPGVIIDYATGDSRLDEETAAEEGSKSQSAAAGTSGSGSGSGSSQEAEITYILNTNTMKFHLPSCSSVKQMSEDNKKAFTGTREEVIQKGYDPCGRCHP